MTIFAGAKAPLKNHASHDGAAALATRIRAYWARRGQRVEIEIHPSYGTKASGSIWALRSDMVNGRPAGPARPARQPDRAAE